MPTLTDDLQRWLRGASEVAGRATLAPRALRTGIVEQVGDGVALVSGLPEARLDELLTVGDGGLGFAASLEPDRIGCVLLAGESAVAAGVRVQGTGEVVRVPVGKVLLGRVIDALGSPLDGGPAIVAERRDPVERPAPPIVDRDFVTRPLHTGITVIDAAVPLGRGQRELVIGDRKTGKTTIAIDAMLAQRRSDVVSVYAAIGQKDSSVNQVIDSVRRFGAPERTIFVVGGANDLPGAQWLVPYAACTMAEYFRDQGGDALLILDDLTKHAAVHRQISLLLRSPPGREAYPGDIFYVHSRLLERAAKLSGAQGGGTLTALPIAETLEGNLSAYIPTNLISITDGQIYLEAKLFHEGQKPAVNVGLSVSRVGGKTQAPVLADLAAKIRLDYAQFLELEVFTRFGAMVDERTRKTIEHGRRVRAVLAQPPLAPRRLGEQVALLVALDAGTLDRLPLDAVERFERELGRRLGGDEVGLLERIESEGAKLEPVRAELVALAERVAAEFAQEAQPPKGQEPS